MERAELIGRCKVEGPPKELLKTHKSIAMLILKMASIEPSIRPTIGQVALHPAFKCFLKERPGERSASLPKMEGPCEKLCGEFSIRLGSRLQWKARHINLNGLNLLIYKKKGDAKARISYPLKDCTITPQRSLRLGGKEKCESQLQLYRKTPRRTASLFARDESNASSPTHGEGKMQRREEESVVLIEHPAIETLSLRFFGTEAQRATWLSCLLNAANKSLLKE